MSQRPERLDTRVASIALHTRAGPCRAGRPDGGGRVEEFEPGGSRSRREPSESGSPSHAGRHPGPDPTAPSSGRVRRSRRRARCAARPSSRSVSASVMGPRASSSPDQALSHPSIQQRASLSDSDRRMCDWCSSGPSPVGRVGCGQCSGVQDCAGEERRGPHASTHPRTRSGPARTPAVSASS